MGLKGCATFCCLLFSPVTNTLVEDNMAKNIIVMIEIIHKSETWMCIPVHTRKLCLIDFYIEKSNCTFCFSNQKFLIIFILFIH